MANFHDRIFQGPLRDPRVFQIAALSSLLVYGVIERAFDVTLMNFAAIVLAACATQWVGSIMFAVKPEFKSSLITGLSLTLLLRADEAWPLALAAVIAIGSKFVFRINNKHVFNPANIGIVAMVLFTDLAWTTPGQWGSAIWLAALMVGIGFFVSYRAARLDVPLVFLGVFSAILIIRALWLGDPLSIPLLRLQNGALVLFAFFMISDPKTTPDGKFARIAFAASAAIIAYVLTYHFFITDGLFYALALMTIVRPLLEFLNPAPYYQWGDRPALAQAPPPFPFIKNTFKERLQVQPTAPKGETP